MSPLLFSPIQLGGITLPNRVVVAPMCQYSADDGSMTDWHLVHLGSMACSGAGLFVVEKTNVTREGRITHGCTGLYNDHNEAAMARAVQVYRGITKNPIGIQIGACRAQGLRAGALAGRQGARAGRIALADRRAVRDRLRRGLARAARVHRARRFAGWWTRSSPRRCARSASASTSWSCIRRTATCCTSSFRRSRTSARTSTARTG